MDTGLKAYRVAAVCGTQKDVGLITNPHGSYEVSAVDAEVGLTASRARARMERHLRASGAKWVTVHKVTRAHDVEVAAEAFAAECWRIMRGVSDGA